jgi:hypothetical protein
MAVLRKISFLHAWWKQSVVAPYPLGRCRDMNVAHGCLQRHFLKFKKTIPELKNSGIY